VLPGDGLSSYPKQRPGQEDGWWSDHASHRPVARAACASNSAASSLSLIIDFLRVWCQRHRVARDDRCHSPTRAQWLAQHSPGLSLRQSPVLRDSQEPPSSGTSRTVDGTMGGNFEVHTLSASSTRSVRTSRSVSLVASLRTLGNIPLRYLNAL
jgi:hypothetical protein